MWSALLTPSSPAFAGKDSPQTVQKGAVKSTRSGGPYQRPGCSLEKAGSPVPASRGGPGCQEGGESETEGNTEAGAVPWAQSVLSSLALVRPYVTCNIKEVPLSLGLGLGLGLLQRLPQKYSSIKPSSLRLIPPGSPVSFNSENIWIWPHVKKHIYGSHKDPECICLCCPVLTMPTTQQGGGQSLGR